jgi:hypothetical protein
MVKDEVQYGRVGARLGQDTAALVWNKVVAHGLDSTRLDTVAGKHSCTCIRLDEVEQGWIRLYEVG